MRPGDRCEVYDLGRWRPAIIDSHPEFGWVCVVGLPARAGSASVLVERVRLSRETDGDNEAAARKKE